MKAYKIVYEQNRKFFSATLDANRTEYYLHKFTKPHPHSGPLACFKTLDYAISFYNKVLVSNRYYFNNDVSTTDIFTNFNVPLYFFKCEIEPSQEKEMYFWYGAERPYQFKRSYMYKIPTGTILANAVKLIEEITYDDL